MKKQNDLVEILKKVYPSLVCEKDGEYEVDIEKLKLELGKGSDIINEGYSLNWLGQSYSRVLRDCPTTTLMKPENNHNQLPENINSDNVYIEADNLEVLKHLKNAYSSKIKIIYIDPPYNTDSDDFVYKDSFNFDVETFMRLSGLVKEEAEKVLNYTKSKRNSHSAWLTFMYPRLYIARELLKDDGVIFISIDDNEQAQLKLLCDQIFGEENFISQFIWQKKSGGGQSKKFYEGHESILIYAKNIECFGGLEKVAKIPGEKINNDFLRKVYGNYKANDDLNELYKKYPKEICNHRNIMYEELDILEKEGFLKSDKRNEIEEKIESGEYFLKPLDNTNFSLICKKDIKQTQTMYSIINSVMNQDSTDEQKNLFGKLVFTDPKPTKLLRELIEGNIQEGIVLDFFSGSASTADAIMQINAERNSSIKYILVQLEEEIIYKDKAGDKQKICNNAYKLCVDELKQEPIIPTIAKERIKRAANKIKEENKDKEYIDDLDLGFKVYKTIKDDRTDVSQLVLFDVKDGIKTEVDDLDALLTTWMLHDGYDLNTKVEEIMINKYKGYRVEQTLYLLDKGFSTEDLLLLVEKLNDPKTFINQIILNSSNFANIVLQEFHENVFSKNSKEAKIVVEDR